MSAITVGLAIVLFVGFWVGVVACARFAANEHDSL